MSSAAYPHFLLAVARQVVEVECYHCIALAASGVAHGVVPEFHLIHIIDIATREQVDVMLDAPVAP